jgi:glutamine synthetase
MNHKPMRREVINREIREIEYPLDQDGNPIKASQLFGESTFDYHTAREIPDHIRKELQEISRSHTPISKDHASVVANAALEWAMARGATHFCHWFQPLTGSTAEKHDAFINVENGLPIEQLSASQLMQGEPDASSFPNGGTRSTFEARGYTTWDLNSPMFLLDGPNGKTLCIPTAFISYTGHALDIKTPLLRSEVRISQAATRFLQATGLNDVKRVGTTCGPEQEYFLIDKAFYYARPDLVMTGRTLFGSPSAKNQQLDDHYFGDISERVMGLMQELDLELYRLGIYAKTRHNEVAPGQYEIAPIFTESNIASDNNQLLMATLRRIAHKHNFEVTYHEKPFAGINGSGKHLNWSLSSDTGLNLLSPGKEPHSNFRFLATVATIIEAINRHGGMIRTSIASASNDHRLGANEAPPSIISVYTGDTLAKIFDEIRKGEKVTSREIGTIESGVQQLADLSKDNTDRNRTSPFAFTGNRFELRACGSDMAIGLPLSILNGAVAEVMDESASYLEEEVKKGTNLDEALIGLTKKWLTNSHQVIFNGDGYSDEWVEEAKKRGLPNLKTSADALPLLKDEKATNFLTTQKIFSKDELVMRHNVLVERYNTVRHIEFNTMVSMINQYVFPAVVKYKNELSQCVKNQKDIGIESAFEKEIYKKLNFASEGLYNRLNQLNNALEELPTDLNEESKTIANKILPLTEEMATFCGQIEELVPDEYWALPKYYDMLFIR